MLRLLRQLAQNATVYPSDLEAAKTLYIPQGKSRTIIAAVIPFHSVIRFKAPNCTENSSAGSETAAQLKHHNPSTKAHHPAEIPETFVTP